VRTGRLLATLLFLSGLSGVAALAQQDQTQSATGDPIADAARKARQEKKSAPKPKKVFTDDDVAAKPAVAEAPAPSNPPTNPSGETPGSTAQAGSQDDSSAKKEDPDSEAQWRKRFAAQRRKIAIAEEELNVLQREAEKADVQYYPDPQKALKEQLTRNEINEKNDKIAAKKKEIADLKQQLSDMEDEVRRTGGDLGWTR